MEIKIRNYIIRPCMAAPTRYDLLKNVTRTNKSTDIDYEGTTDIGYGMTLENCIGDIIFLEVNLKNNTCDLKEYLAEYRKVKDEIAKLATV